MLFSYSKRASDKKTNASKTLEPELIKNQESATLEIEQASPTSDQYIRNRKCGVVFIGRGLQVRELINDVPLD